MPTITRFTRPATGIDTREIRFGFDSIFPGATTSSSATRFDWIASTLMRVSNGESDGMLTVPLELDGFGGGASAGCGFPQLESKLRIAAANAEE